MFDYSKYNLGQLVAIMDILQYIDEGGRIGDHLEKCREAIYVKVNREAMDQLQSFKESLVREFLTGMVFGNDR